MTRPLIYVEAHSGIPGARAAAVAAFVLAASFAVTAGATAAVRREPPPTASPASPQASAPLPDSALRGRPHARPAETDPRTLRARAALLRLAAARARAAHLSRVDTRVYLELVREAFEHRMDEDLDPEDIAADTGTTPRQASAALRRCRRLGLLDLSRLAARDPLTAAEAMNVPWLAGLGDSDRGVLRYLMKHPGTRSNPTTVAAAQTAVGAPPDTTQRARLAVLFERHPEICPALVPQDATNQR